MTALDDVDLLRESLLRGLRVDLGSEDGDIAFERHTLLAIRFHRAAGLNQTQEGEGAGWREYFREHFPKSAAWRLAYAKLLWDDWRFGLVKWETPRAGVTVTHGQPETHWYREPGGTLCINLESMWDDFEVSVESFMTLLRTDDARRREAIARWRQRSWTVRNLVVAETWRSYECSITAVSAARSATAMAPWNPPSSST